MRLPSPAVLRRALYRVGRAGLLLQLVALGLTTTATGILAVSLPLAPAEQRPWLAAYAGLLLGAAVLLWLGQRLGLWLLGLAGVATGLALLPELRDPARFTNAALSLLVLATAFGAALHAFATQRRAAAAGVMPLPAPSTAGISSLPASAKAGSRAAARQRHRQARRALTTPRA